MLATAWTGRPSQGTGANADKSVAMGGSVSASWLSMAFRCRYASSTSTSIRLVDGSREGIPFSDSDVDSGLASLRTFRGLGDDRRPGLLTGLFRCPVPRRFQNAGIVEESRCTQTKCRWDQVLMGAIHEASILCSVRCWSSSVSRDIQRRHAQRCAVNSAKVRADDLKRHK